MSRQQRARMRRAHLKYLQQRSYSLPNMEVMKEYSHRGRDTRLVPDTDLNLEFWRNLRNEYETFCYRDNRMQWVEVYIDEDDDLVRVPPVVIVALQLEQSTWRNQTVNRFHAIRWHESIKRTVRLFFCGSLYFLLEEDHLRGKIQRSLVYNDREQLVSDWNNGLVKWYGVELRSSIPPP